jgi:hypothetical protein
VYVIFPRLAKRLYLTYIGTEDANEAITISLVRPATPKIEKVASFNPKFTYPIFGEEETIFGYKGLKVNLQYDARNLRPHLSVSSSKKFNSVGDVEAVDIREVMKEFLPGGLSLSVPDGHYLAITSNTPQSHSKHGQNTRKLLRTCRIRGPLRAL